MNILIIGSGGREHALAWAIKKSSKCENIYVMTGNGGTLSLAKNININSSNKEAVLDFCWEAKIDLVVIGPEIPLVDGLSDFLRENNISVFGPSKNAAMIEADKAYAKLIMQRANVPTARFNEFNRALYNNALNYADSIGYPVVVKANGLAAGKGVSICFSKVEVNSVLEEIFIKDIFGESGNKIIIEEFLEGDEASIFAITDGEKFICLPAAQDHKRIGDGDTGKNTGGMGAYAPTSLVTDELMEQIKNQIITPVLIKMRNDGNPFSGCLYCGLIFTKTGPKVIEFNCRFGDPETQVVLPLLDGDFLELLLSSARGKLNENAVIYNGGSAVTIVAASNGYPDKYDKGFEISGLNNFKDEDVIIFHAGSAEKNGKIVTNGGRVLNITVLNKNNYLGEAIDKAYSVINQIKFENIYYRKDIGQKGLKYLTNQA
jgi:phosphoribosylamine--glycine ligase